MMGDRILSRTKRLVLFVGLPIFVVITTCLCHSQTSLSSQKECKDAQVIAIQGGWIANPGSRPLANWSCVSAGDEITLSSASTAGQLTVIYHSGTIQPHAIKCESREKCRNAYRVEAASVRSGAPKTTIDLLLDFFFSIFNGDESQPVPGILQGEAAPAPRPFLTCSNGRRVQLDSILKPGLYNLQITALNAQAKRVTWEAEGAGDTLHLHAAAPRTHQHTWAIMSEPLIEPALYAVATGPIGANSPDSSLRLVITPETSCNLVRNSYSEAVQFTLTWPKDIPQDAINNFQLRYLEDLALQPNKAPQDDSPLRPPTPPSHD